MQKKLKTPIKKFLDTLLGLKIQNIFVSRHLWSTPNQKFRAVSFLLFFCLLLLVLTTLTILFGII